MNNDLRRWSDIKQTLLDYHNGLVMSKFLTEADCRNARFAVEGALYELELVPAVDAVEVVHAKWEINWCDNNLIGHEYEECSNCGCSMVDTNQFWNSNYCPNCGARMDGE